MAIPPFPLQELHRFDHYFSALVWLLIILRQPIILSNYPIPFLVPQLLSVHISLGAQYRPVSLNMPAIRRFRILWYFITKILTLPH
ncbi:MAG TPA: hypothetical protein DIT54_00010 [Lachnospiraceae bacterium]|nr:hypothetical protein [Lachnospiraceae bacterium]